jgi:DNA-binding beta-propeller fold protein YncE
MNLIKKLLVITSVIGLAGCTNDKNPIAEQIGYPKEVATIITYKCATEGCHNTQSAGNAGGLDFSTWDKMFEGGRNGSSVIPFSDDYSYMLYFINTFSDLGISLEPRMPYNQPRLSRDEVMTLRNWIGNGAPNSEGFVKFSDNPARKKFYVCMQGCDMVAVFDAESRVIMRYIKVGVSDASIEGPHDIGITPDGKYWAMSFISGHIVQFYNTTDDKLAATVEIGSGSWNIITFSDDSRKAYLSSTDLSNGKIAEIDIPTFTHTRDISTFASPHGMELSPDGTILYVTEQADSKVAKIHLDDLSYDIVNTGGQDIHQIEFAPDESRYYVSCRATNEIRVFRTSDDSLLLVIPVGAYPQEMELSHDPLHPYMYVTCTEDVWSSSAKGSVYVINYNTNQVVTHLYTGYQPHGIDVDDDHHVVYVANLNYDAAGPPPHHVTGCGGKNGYVTIIDMNTLQLLNVTLHDGTTYPYKNEVLPFPYEVAYRK